jgi:hypothetical protein
MTGKLFKAILSLTFVVLLAFLPANVFADIATIQPSYQDVTIYDGFPDNNYNHLSYISVIGRGSSPMRCLVQFDLSSIPLGSKIVSANLSLYYLDRPTVDPVGRIYWAYRVSQSWHEGLATWNTYDGSNPWTTPGSDYTTTGGASAVVPSTLDTWMTWDVTDIVKAWIENGQSNDGFVVRDGNETGTAIIQALFNSREASSNRPILEVSYTPYVGGDIIAVNTLSLLTPWIVAVVILTGTVIAFKRRLARALLWNIDIT